MRCYAFVLYFYGKATTELISIKLKILPTRMDILNNSWPENFATMVLSDSYLSQRFD